jgi:hypothetical protein
MPPRLLGSSAFLWWGQRQVDIRIHPIGQPDVYPKFRLIHESDILLWGAVLHIETQAAELAAWIPGPAPAGMIAADLLGMIHLAPPPAPIPLLPRNIFLNGRWVIGFRVWFLSKYTVATSPNWVFRYEEHQRTEHLVDPQPVLGGNVREFTRITYGPQIQEWRLTH